MADEGQTSGASGIPGTPDQSARTSLRKQEEARGGQEAVDPWAPPSADSREPSAGQVQGTGPGHTLVPGAPSPWAAPSVHDQQTITSLPAAGGGVGAPFPPPPAPVPYAAHGEPVPPPPIGPEGPGRVPYITPGGTPGHGYASPFPGGAGYPGWPGSPPMPSNGMGTAGLALGIVSAVIFCLWPLAIVLGVLAVIFGAIGRAKALRGEATNAGQALAGIICGVAGVVLGVGMVVLVALKEAM